MDTTLDAILGGTTPVADTTQAQASPEPVAAKPEGGDSQKTTGEPAKAENEAGTPPAEKPKAEKSEADKAFATLRRELKNERLQREALERQMAALQQPAQVIDPVADPDGFSKSIDDKIARAKLETKVSISERLAMKNYADYEEVRDTFMEIARDNPAIVREMYASDDPAEFAYAYAKEHKARQEIGDPLKYAEKIREETIAKTMAELDKIVEAKLQERLSGVLPSSLAETQSQGARVTNPDGFNGPTPLSDILKKR
jgi:hypothetical protein